ncbi:hypothetical protein JAV76_11680 [Sanguibacter sp. YZGR15]|uniref:Uncharacterized protein n=2 Tax=Sanguibacter suaedae TaxID=2795737 RepID=A0A934IEX1_9MICO|nr:hypothetical protein [Sanguibacter suaedae]
MMCRLRDHIERIDNGAAYAADDLAVVLRALLAPAHGNDVLRRLEDSSGIDPSRILVTRQADTTAKFSVGSLPTRPGAEVHGAEWVPWRDWIQRPVVHTECQGASVTYSWAKFLSTYANKWGGAHLDRTVPTHLQLIDGWSFGGLLLSGYLLRSAGLVAWAHTHRALSQGKFRLGTASLSTEVDEKARLGVPGSIATDPRDQLALGELQWLTLTSEELAFHLYVDPSQPVSARMAPSAIPFEMTFKPSDVTREPPVRNEVRQVAPKNVVAAADSSRSLRMSGRITAPPTSNVTE